MSEESWSNTFDAITDLVSMLDRDFRIVRVNKALAGFLGKKPEELIGQHCYEVMHGRTSHWDSCPHDRMMKEKKATTLVVDDPHIGIPLLITASPIFNSEGDLVGSVHVAKDISTIRKIEDDLAIRNQQLEALNRLTGQAIKSQSLKEVVQVALDGVMGACSPDFALYYTIADDWLILQGAVPAEEQHINEKKKVGTCLCGLAAEHGLSVFSEDIHCDGRCTLNECKDAGVHSFAALPIMHNNVVIGVLGIASKTEKKYSDERTFLETLAATIGIVSQNAMMIEKMKNESQLLEQKVAERTTALTEKAKDLSRSQQDLQYLLADASEAKKELEAKIVEIERMNRIFVHRELRMVELKEKIKELEQNRQHSADN